MANARACFLALSLSPVFKNSFFFFFSHSYIRFLILIFIFPYGLRVEALVVRGRNCAPLYSAVFFFFCCCFCLFSWFIERIRLYYHCCYCCY